MLSTGFLLQILADGLIAGSVYVLVAIGLTLVFGVLGIANFAHGEFYMLGGYFGIAAAALLKVGVIEALVIALVMTGILAFLIDRLVFLPLKGRDMTSTIIVSFGLSVLLQNGVLLVFGPEPEVFHTNWSSIPIELGDVYLTLSRAIIPVFALAAVIVIHVVLRHSWAGRSLQALSQNPMIAQLCGIDVGRVALGTFIIGGMLAGAAGLLMSSVFVVQPGTGSMVVLKAFTVVILGGLGSVYGAVAAGLLLGLAEVATAAFVNNLAKDTVAFGLVIVVLLVRPQGLFGRPVGRV
jgi:branched-chain amino acid transport system permease protein